jgi:hypothetical protein
LHIEEERVWKYLLEHRQATPEEVAHHTGASLELVNSCIDRISSPNWREEVEHNEWNEQYVRNPHTTLSLRDIMIYRVIKAVQRADTIVLREVAEKLGIK